MKLRQLFRDLGALRFEKVSQVGSHVKLRHPNGSSIVVYDHGHDEEVSRVVAKAIMRSARDRTAPCVTADRCAILSPR